MLLVEGGGAGKDAADRWPRQFRFGQERDRRTVRDYLLEVLARVGGDEDHAWPGWAAC